MAATSLVDAGARRLLAREGQTLHAREHVSSVRGLADCVAQRVHSQRGTACSLACGRGARPGERAAEASRRLCARDGWSTRHSQLGFVAAHGLQQLGQRLFVLCVALLEVYAAVVHADLSIDHRRHTIVAWQHRHQIRAVVGEEGAAGPPLPVAVEREPRRCRRVAAHVQPRRDGGAGAGERGPCRSGSGRAGPGSPSCGASRRGCSRRTAPPQHCSSQQAGARASRSAAAAAAAGRPTRAGTPRPRPAGAGRGSAGSRARESSAQATGGGHAGAAGRAHQSLRQAYSRNHAPRGSTQSQDYMNETRHIEHTIEQKASCCVETPASSASAAGRARISLSAASSTAHAGRRSRTAKSALVSSHFEGE